MSVQTEVITFEIAIEKTWDHNKRVNFFRSLTQDVMRQAVVNARESAVVLRRVAVVPNRSHSKKA